MTKINPTNYKILQNTWESNSHKVYLEISNSVVGGRSGLPRLGPIPGPLPEPSPLNVEWRKQYSQDLSKNLFGIL
jgi:hypothetical protein